MKTYIKFLINLFNISFLKVFIVFFIIILTTNILEQIDFFKNLNLSFFYLLFLSFLNTPSILFQILPFIFLLSTQIFFIYLIDRNELEIFKYTGLNNIKILKILGVYSFILGLIFIIFFYNISSVLKNSFLLIKNNYSEDNKYLAVITENGLWIKDEINNDINIINASKVNNEFLLDVSITRFNKNFNVIEVLQSEKIDIKNENWILKKYEGDCDTRTIFLYTLLKKYNYDVVILNSIVYKHSILGINLPTSGSNYKYDNGRRYYAWETTAKDMKRGLMSPSWSNMNNWFIALK